MTSYLNGQNPNPSLPSWFTISSPAADEAKIVLNSGLDTFGTDVKEGLGVLKWKVSSGENSLFDNLKVIFDVDGTAEAAVSVAGNLVTAKARSRENNAKVATNFLVQTGIGHKDDKKSESTVQTLHYKNPTWTYENGQYSILIKSEFALLKGYNALTVSSGPETGQNNCYAKPYVMFSDPYAEITPTAQQALGIDDGRIRLYILMNGVVPTSSSGGTNSSEDATVELYTSNNVLLSSGRHVVSDPEGEIYVDSSGPQPAGTYRLFLKPRNGLRKLTQFFFDGSSPHNLTVTFKWGDINEDNIVSQADLDIINHWLGIESTSVDWTTMDEFTEYSPVDCDLNDDLVVNGTDYAMALLNLGVVGD